MPKGLDYVKKQVDLANKGQLSPIMGQALSDYKKLSHDAGRTVSPEEEEEFKKKLLTEQLRCQTLTKDSIGEERKSRAKITLFWSLAAAVFIIFLAAIIAPASIPFLPALLIPPFVQYAISMGTIKQGRDDRLKGAANSVIGLQIKADHDKALEVAKAKPQVGAAGKEEAKEAILGLSAKDPAFSTSLAKIRAANLNENKEVALPLHGFYGISKARNSGGRVASVAA